MATILKGYRGNSNPEDTIKNITSTYDSDIMGGKKKKGEEVVDAVTKHEALVTKAEEKGWSDRKRIRKGVDVDPTAGDPNYKAVYNLRGDLWETKIINKPSGSISSTDPIVKDKEVDVKYKPIKVKTQKSPYKSKYLKTSFFSKLFGGSGSFRTNVRRTKDVSGKRIGRR